MLKTQIKREPYPGKDYFWEKIEIKSKNFAAAENV